MNLSANASGLSAGPYQTSVTVAAGSASVNITVTFAVSNPIGAIAASPTSIAFAQSLGEGAPSSQIIAVTAGTATSFTATTSSGTWLTVSPTSGTTPATLTLTANGTGLSAGTYQNSVTITGGGTSVVVPVTFTVSAQGTLAATPNTVGFVQNNGVLAPTYAVQVTAATATSFTTTIDTKGSGTWLMISPSSGSTPATLTFSVNTAGLSAGTYPPPITTPTPQHPECTVANPCANPAIVTIKAGGASVTVLVQLTISNTGSIAASPVALSFSQMFGGTSPPSQTVQLTSPAASLATAFTAVSGSTWLNVTPTSGGTPANLTVTVNGAGLSPGVYQGAITISGGGPPFAIPVTFTVSSTSLPRQHR